MYGKIIHSNLGFTVLGLVLIFRVLPFNRFSLEDSDRQLRVQLSGEKQRTAALEKALKESNQHNNSNNNALNVEGTIAAKLVRRYGELYSQLRLDTLDALDALPELINSDELKNKLLFSVVVVTISFVKLVDLSTIMATHSNISFIKLAFRSAAATVESKREQVRRVLQLSGNDASAALESAMATYLMRSAADFDLARVAEEVLKQILATLYDYPRLKDCEGIVAYVKECVRVAWGLVNQVCTQHTYTSNKNKSYSYKFA
jgi:hypothetical protein